jgi:GNAT superfamily N-acetyltransferase
MPTGASPTTTARSGSEEECGVSKPRRVGDDVRDENGSQRTGAPPVCHPRPVTPRRASGSDAAAVAEAIAGAFATDPVWEVALRRRDGSIDHHVDHWRRYVDAAIPGGWVWLTEGGEAASVWIAPGEHEMTPAQEASLAVELADWLGPDGRDDYLDLTSRFADAHPASPPHYSLSLLATHPAQRGRGLGMALLRANLELIDAEGMPAYLESTNPANDARYAGVGFERHGEFRATRDGAVITTMWRPARR